MTSALGVCAEVVELVDTHASGACDFGCGGSSPPFRTTFLY